jgi:hypothetical protein
MMPTRTFTPGYRVHTCELRTGAVRGRLHAAALNGART